MKYDFLDFFKLLCFDKKLEGFIRGEYPET